VSQSCPLRRAARAVRRALLPSFDLLLLQRCRLARFVPPGAAVLDAGCGDGTIAFRLARKGCRVVAVSDDASALAAFRERTLAARLPAGQVAFREHDLTAGTPPGGPFDAVICFDVLEHIAADGAVVCSLAVVLRPGGSLLLTVPNREAPPLWGDTVAPESHGAHVRQGYTRPELERLVTAAGLEPARWGGFGGAVTRLATNVSRRLERHGGVLFVVIRFLWLVLLRPLCCLDPLVPRRNYELFLLAVRPVDSARKRGTMAGGHPATGEYNE